MIKLGIILQTMAPNGNNINLIARWVWLKNLVKRHMNKNSELNLIHNKAHLLTLVMISVVYLFIEYTGWWLQWSSLWKLRLISSDSNDTIKKYINNKKIKTHIVQFVEKPL